MAAEDLSRVAAESEGHLSAGGLLGSLRAGRQSLLLVTSAGVYAGCIVLEAGARALVVVAARIRPRYNGNVFREALEILGDLARDSGLELTGWSTRPGMGRLLERCGWRRRFVEYVAPQP
jgi:hypothetical protein